MQKNTGEFIRRNNSFDAEILTQKTAISFLIKVHSFKQKHNDFAKTDGLQLKK